MVLIVAAFSSCKSITQTGTAMEKNTKTISLKKGQRFLLISSILKKGKEKLLKNYFEMVFPVASKYGFKPLLRLSIDEIVAGNYKPNTFVGLYSWPKASSEVDFRKEKSMANIDEKRKKIWTELQQIKFDLSKDIEITFRKGKVYQVASIWIKKEGIKDLKKYLSATKTTIEKLGGRTVFKQKVNDFATLSDGTPPSLVAILEWPSVEARKAYLNSKIFTENIKYFKSGITNFQAMLTSM